MRHSSTITIAIADDHRLFRKGLKLILEQTKEFKIAAEASTGKELLDAIEKTSPQVVLTDIQMPEMNGIEATQALSKKYPQLGIIGISMFQNEEMVVSMIRAGARAFLSKTTDPAEIKKAVKTVCTNGGYYLDNIPTKMLKTLFGSKASITKDEVQFSKTELQIIKLVCQQYSSKEIATKLSITLKAVECARERIQYKTGAKNVTGIVLYAIRHGIHELG